MDELFINSLDYEYKQYLEILRPQLGQLKDERVISVCNNWVQRLSNCKNNEKILRNKYILKLCYQLTKGNLDMPFLREPRDEDLQPISEPNFSEITSEVECLVIDSEDVNTKVLFDKKASLSESEFMSQDIEEDDSKQCKTYDSSRTSFRDNIATSHKQAFFCYQCPEIQTKYEQFENLTDGYEHRTNNIISKLREIKKQNVLLHNELQELKEKSSNDECFENKVIQVNNATSAYVNLNKSSSTVKCLKTKLKEVEDVRNALIQKIQNMQETLDNYNDMKIHEIESLDAKYKLELINVKSSIKEEVKQLYENKLDELKQHHELKIAELESKHLKEIQELTALKDNVIADRDNIIKEKDAKIAKQLDEISENKQNFHSILDKILNKPDDEQIGSIKMRGELEKRLQRLEKSKNKTTRALEAKIASLHRENHLTECSLQLQLVRQRAQIVNDITDDTQTELKNTLDKLEAKYKDIVANMQATAIQRRMQDQMAVESILQAACGIQNEAFNLVAKGFSGNAARVQNDVNYSYDSEVSALFHGNKGFGNVCVGGNKPFRDGSGYCVAGELGPLFEKVYVPQRDTNDEVRK